MFRAAVNNEMDSAVARATDETLVSENWEYILNVVDKVSSSPNGPANATASLIKRLAHRNANVQLYTLELANSLSANVGAPMHRELASKAFTDSLLRLTADRTTHAQVKQKVLERMAAWTEEFGRNPDFGIMTQAYERLRREQPSLVPPSKPQKQEITAEERRKEDEELELALALSIKDKGASSSSAGGGSASAGGQTNGTSRDDSVQQPAQTPAQQQSQHGTTAATVSRVRALYDFTPSEPGELAFRKNDIIAVLESVYKDWWRGSLRGTSGIFPLNYVEKLQDPTREELERDAQMEAEVFGEMKNIEKLLALLSVRGEGRGGRRGEREEDEIAELYQRCLGVRPKLVELIDKYSQKKDDFEQLNEKFIKARRDYEALLESSMSHSQYQQQQQHPIRQGSRTQMYPPRMPQQQQQPPYQQLPPAGYPPQVPQSAGPYPPQPQSYPPQQQQSMAPPQSQHDPQRFYSPAPSEPPGPGPEAGYTSPYPQSNGPPQIQPQQPVQPPNGAPGSGGAGVAPFHFIPGGLQSAPPPLQPPQQEIRRKPTPSGPLSAGPGSGPSDPYAGQQAMAAGGMTFQGQIRPNSIHTLNSGAPQELATSQPGFGAESPVDNRMSYPPAGPQGQYMQGGMPPQQQQQQGYDGAGYEYDSYPTPQPQAQQLPSQPQGMQQQQMLDDRDGLPSRQRTHSFESAAGSSVYSTQQQPPQGYGGYQAYQPQQAVQQGMSGGGDPGDFYR